MARPGTRWLLSIFLIILPGGSALPGPPPPPSAPRCYIPFEPYGMWNIHCDWGQTGHYNVPVRYTLYWMSPDNRGQVEGTNCSALIQRASISIHSGLIVWVQAENQYGSATSSNTTFNTGDIMKPPTPFIQQVDVGEEDLEVSWVSQCDQLMRSLSSCEVRQRTERDPGWSEVESQLCGTFTIENPQPFTVYEFQARYNCSGSGQMMSDWSAVYRVQTAGAAPVGQLDVWRDCGNSYKNSECFLMWKKLPRLKARGVILGYEVTLSYSNGTTQVRNMSLKTPKVGKGQPLICDGTHCHLSTPLLGVSAASVSAYSMHGTTTPAALAMPVPSTQSDNPTISVRMDERSLTVFWDLLSPPVGNLKEYLVQYKQVGRPLSQGFDWIRVNKSQTSVVLKGNFKNYGAYQTSLFMILQTGDKYQLMSTATEYAIQGIPPSVSSFKVDSIASTHVTLSWEPIPVTKRNGTLLCYQIGLNNHEVYRVNGSKSRTFRLERLHPGQEYEVWIRALTEAGLGPNTTTRFRTTGADDMEGHMVLLAIILPVLLISIVGVMFIRSLCSCGKVPDPQNSSIFKQMKHQFNDFRALASATIPEPILVISQVEVVEQQPQASEVCSMEALWPDTKTDQELADKITQMNREGSQWEEADKAWVRTEGRSGLERQAYETMVEPLEEREGEEDEEEGGTSDSSSLLDEDQFCSGYETHFMPSESDL